jgi:uncharacterized protein YgbK (DUF1537 family)
MAQIGYYGDDFTGSAANLLEFHRRGLSGLLYVKTPTREQLARDAADVDVVGIAGIARSLSPQEIPAEVAPALRLLRDHGCRVVHYKVCSTFDSAPHRGSFGPVLELAAELFGAGPVAVLAAHPAFGRYTVFGQHFAAYGDEVFRLDRHPSMSRHPETPMGEADLRRHLATMTDLPSTLCDLQALRSVDAAAIAALLQGDEARCVVFDALEPEDLVRIAAGVWLAASRKPVFTLSSHGFAAGLADHLGAARDAGTGSPQPEVERVLVLSGSCTPRTAAQIDHVQSLGWATMRLPVEALATSDEAAIVQRLAADVLQALAQKRSIVVYTAAGPDDGTIEAGRETFARMARESSAVIGRLYAALLDRVAASAALPRFVLAGGDTSSQTLRALGVAGLRIAAVNLASQEPLLRIHAPGSRFDAAQVLLKAGQNGGEDYFEAARRGSGWA